MSNYFWRTDVVSAKSPKGALFLRFLLKVGAYELFFEHVKVSIEDCQSLMKEVIDGSFLIDNTLPDDIFGRLINMSMPHTQHMVPIYKEWYSIYRLYKEKKLQDALKQIKKLK